MSRTITKSAAVVAVAALAFLSLFSLQDADAQNYAPEPGTLQLILIEPQGTLSPILCGGQPYGTISGGVPPYTVTYNLTGTATVGLGSIVVPNQGNFVAPAGTIDYASIPDGPYTVNYTVRDNIGSIYVGSYPAVITDNCDGGADATPGGAAAPAVPAAVPVPQDQLAFTGSSTSLPVTAGAILIGSGGLMLLAANKRSRERI